METYITVSFWIGVLGIVIRLGYMIVADYPRKKTESLGECVAIALISAGFVVWAGILLYV